MYFVDPSTLGESWILSDGKNPVEISPNVLKHFGRQDVIALDSLYCKFRKGLNGLILNEEENFNPQLQVSALLGALYRSIKNKFLILILCPDDLLVKWHYYISLASDLKIKTITPSTVPEDFDQDTGVALLLNFGNIKLAEFLQEYDLGFVVIDHIDEVATKLVIKKLQGRFNVGITLKNFYVNRDPKVQWTILNWASNGCVGKLKNFYRIDEDNFLNNRNNYKEWWFRITWSFCDSFVKPTLEEIGILNNSLRDWARAHNLTEYYLLEKKKTYNRRKLTDSNEKAPSRKKRRKRNISNELQLKGGSRENSNDQVTPGTSKTTPDFSDSSNSVDTVIYETDLSTNSKQKGADENVNETFIEASLEKIQINRDDVQDGKFISEKENSKEKLPECSITQYEDENEDSGDELLLSLAGIKPKKCIKKVRKQEYNITENCDESDLFLKSVASTSGSLSQFEKHKTESFLDKILDKSASNEKPDTALTQFELELSQMEVSDVPSESDGFLNRILKRKLSESKDSPEINECCTRDKKFDIDSLVAEVMEMVRKK